MRIDPDDIDASRPTPKLRDLQPMSLQELEGYITILEQEIIRAQAMIAQKQSHKSGLEALFRAKKE